MEPIREILKRTGLTRPKTTSEVSSASHNATTCPKCNGGGWLYPLSPEGKFDYSRVVRCSCKEQEDRRERYRRLLEMCEIPDNLTGKTFGNFKVSKGNTDTVSVARAMAEGTGPVKFLTLCGETDTGKTHLALAICNRWLERKQPARYAYVPALLDELRAGIEDKSYGYRYNVYCNVPLLVLDDLGLENTGRWVTERLTTLINTRLVNGLFLVVTTNKPLDELPGDEEHRIASRLTRESFCHTAVMKYIKH